MVCVVSVMMPAWLPVNEAAGTPSSASAMHSRDIEIRSPAVSSMSSSRPGPHSAHVLGEADEPVGGLAHGADHDDDIGATAPCAGDMVRDGTDAVGVADRGPAELLDNEGHARQPTAGPRARATGRPQWRSSRGRAFCVATQPAYALRPAQVR